MSTRGTPCRSNRTLHADANAGQHQGHGRPGRRDQELLARRRRLLLDLREAAERVEQYPAHRQPEAPGHHAVAQLVHQHRQVEQHDEGDGDEVPGALSPGRCPAACWSSSTARPAPRRPRTTARCRPGCQRPRDDDASRGSCRGGRPAGAGPPSAAGRLAAIPGATAPMLRGEPHRQPQQRERGRPARRRPDGRRCQSSPLVCEHERHTRRAGEAWPGRRRPCRDGPSLSPSRAADFMTCPLLYRFRVVDRLPEPPSPAAARGTLVHAVLERLFDEPASGRTPAAARSLLAPQWDRAAARPSPRWPTCSPTSAERAGLDRRGRADAGPLLHAGGPDPDRAGLPRDVGASPAGVRADAARLHRPAGCRAYRRAAHRRLQDRRCAARGVRGQGAVPDEVLRRRALAHPAARSRACCSSSTWATARSSATRPDEADLLATERKINALWQAIDRATESGDWRPHQSRLCDWCSLPGALPGIRRHAAAAA